MNLVNQKVSLKKKWFRKNNYWLIIEDRERRPSGKFKTAYHKLEEGILKVYKDTHTERYFLYEADGINILVSTFFRGHRNGIIWEALTVNPYEDARDPKSKMIIPAGEFIKKFHS